MWPPPGSLTADFWGAFGAAWIYCGSVLALSRTASAPLMGKVTFAKVFDELDQAEKTLWHSYVYCLLPGAICWLLALDDLFNMASSAGAWDAQHVLTTPSPPGPGVLRAVGWELGFLAFDLGVMCIWRRHLMKAMQPVMYVQMLVHHALALFIWPQALQRGTGVSIIVYLAGTEVTSLFINFRWLLLKGGLGDRPVYFINGAALVASFFIVRILPIPWLLWALFAGSKVDLTILEVVIAYASIPIPAALNLYWFTSVVQGVIEALCPRRATPALARSSLREAKECLATRGN